MKEVLLCYISLGVDDDGNENEYGETLTVATNSLDYFRGVWTLREGRGIIATKLITFHEKHTSI